MRIIATFRLPLYYDPPVARVRPAVDILSRFYVTLPRMARVQVGLGNHTIGIDVIRRAESIGDHEQPSHACYALSHSGGGKGWDLPITYDSSFQPAVARRLSGVLLVFHNQTFISFKQLSRYARN